MKKKVITLLLTLSMPVILCGCVSQKDYDELQSEKEALEKQVEELESDKSALESDKQDLENQVAELTEERDKALSDYEDLENQLTEAKELVDKYVSMYSGGKTSGSSDSSDGSSSSDGVDLEEIEEIGDLLGIDVGDIAEELGDIDLSQLPVDPSQLGDLLSEYMN